MKKILYIITIIFALSSCDCMEYCVRCGVYHEWNEPCPYENMGGSFKHRDEDVFSQSKLIGFWQTNGTYVDNMELLSIRFIDDKRCDIEMKKKYDTNNPTYTFKYLYTQKTIKFTKDGKTIEFHIDSYLSPTLTVSDSFGRYKWNKRW